jgi:hypothetical protein
MPRKRRRFSRQEGVRSYRRLFVIAVEGQRTEFDYFGLFNTEESTVQVRCLRSRHNSAPAQVLKRMEAELEAKALRTGDEAWLVVDRDEWAVSQLDELYRWAEAAGNRGFALSNPKFEFWLLLHFEEGKGIGSSRECSERLFRYIPDYDKRIKPGTFDSDRIKAAIQRARVRDNPPCADWPRQMGSTTLYRLVQKLME